MYDTHPIYKIHRWPHTPTAMAEPKANKTVWWTEIYVFNTGGVSGKITIIKDLFLINVLLITGIISRTRQD